MIEAALKQAHTEASQAPQMSSDSTWRKRTSSSRVWQACAIVGVLMLTVAGGATAALVIVKTLGQGITRPEVIESGARRPATSRRTPPAPAKVSLTDAPSLAINEPPPHVDEVATPRRRVKAQLHREPVDLLEEANRLRAAGAWQEAEHMYRRVARQWPGAAAAYAAHIAIAGLLNEQGKFDGAARLYKQSIAARPYGILAEEARLGLVDAYARLKDRAAERHALQDFLRAHPDSVSAKRVRARLMDL